MTLDRYLAALLDGDATPLTAIRAATGGRTGVFTIWYRGELLYLGRSYGDPRHTDNPQADGVTGRIRGATRQPPVSIQRALASNWPQDWASAPGPTDQKRASYLLQAHGECRYVRLPSRAETEAVYHDVDEHLALHRLPLADHHR